MKWQDAVTPIKTAKEGYCLFDLIEISIIVSDKGKPQAQISSFYIVILIVESYLCKLYFSWVKPIFKC